MASLFCDVNFTKIISFARPGGVIHLGQGCGQVRRSVKRRGNRKDRRRHGRYSRPDGRLHQKEPQGRGGQTVGQRSIHPWRICDVCSISGNLLCLL